MILMDSYKEKGYLVRRIVFVHSILLYNSMSNFTDHEFDKEGLIRKVSKLLEQRIHLSTSQTAERSFVFRMQKNHCPSLYSSNRPTPASLNSHPKFSMYRRIESH